MEAKYGLKTLYISIYGGNITIMMSKTIIIWIRRIKIEAFHCKMIRWIPSNEAEK